MRNEIRVPSTRTTLTTPTTLPTRCTRIDAADVSHVYTWNKDVQTVGLQNSHPAGGGKDWRPRFAISSVRYGHSS